MASAPCFVLFTDYGLGGPWVGQLHAVIRARIPDAAIVDLQHDAPPFRPRGAGLLLAAQRSWWPPGATVVAVVDPGVGGSRAGLLLELADGCRVIGPDNGLLAPLLPTARVVERIDWRPDPLPPTFHGRDWFVPAAVRRALGEPLSTTPLSAADCVGHDWPARLDEVVYVDRFGNLVTGIPADAFPAGERELAGRRLPHARTFSEMPAGQPFWHAGALGLVEIAVNRGSAADLLGLRVGDPV